MALDITQPPDSRSQQLCCRMERLQFAADRILKIVGQALLTISGKMELVEPFCRLTVTYHLLVSSCKVCPQGPCKRVRQDGSGTGALFDNLRSTRKAICRSPLPICRDRPMRTAKADLRAGLGCCMTQ